MSLEGDKASLSTHIDSLKGELLNKSTELEEREHQYKELQSQLTEAGQKHTKDLENVGVQVAQLEAKVIYCIGFLILKYCIISNCKTWHPTSVFYNGNSY